MHAIARESLRLSVTLLVASVGLILASLAGLEGSLGLVTILVGITIGLYAVREDLAAVDRVWLYEPGPLLAVVWTGPLVAAAIVLGFGLNASPGEIQAFGGLCGLAGMLNYFLRPVYALVASLLGIAGRSAS